MQSRYAASRFWCSGDRQVAGSGVRNDREYPPSDLPVATTPASRTLHQPCYGWRSSVAPTGAYVLDWLSHGWHRGLESVAPPGLSYAPRATNHEPLTPNPQPPTPRPAARLLLVWPWL